jgi:DNA-directed RNA polymerase specialized sigma24 family protein
MVPGPEPSRARTLGRTVPVQRFQVPDDVPVDWLDEPANAEAADRIDRLAADNDLVTGLAWRQFSGRDYEIFQTELARYGIAVLSGWMRRRLIFQRVRERGYGGLPDPPEGALDDPDTVEELAQETVAKALRHFHDDVLVPGKWDYRRGATLRTYFIGQCLIRFANVYRRWWAEEVRHGRVMSTDPHDARQLADRPVESPEARLVQQDQVARALSRVCNPKVQRALVLHGAGMTYTEIAYDLHVTPKAVERMIANERDRMRKRGIA